MNISLSSGLWWDNLALTPVQGRGHRQDTYDVLSPRARQIKELAKFEWVFKGLYVLRSRL